MCRTSRRFTFSKWQQRVSTPTMSLLAYAVFGCPSPYVRDTDLILIDCPAGKLELLIPSGAGEAPIKTLSDRTESFHHSFTFGNTDP